MSTHSVNVIRIPEVEKHPMADTLGMVEACSKKIIIIVESMEKT